MLTCEQLRAARAILRWRAVDLVEKTGVSLSTVQRAEKADGPVPMIAANEKAIRRAFEEAGIEFIDGEKPGVRSHVARKAVAERKAEKAERDADYGGPATFVKRV